MHRPAPSRTTQHVKSLNAACFRKGLRLRASQGTLIVTRFGHSVTVSLETDEEGELYWGVIGAEGAGGTAEVELIAPVGAEIAAAARIAEHLDSAADFARRPPAQS
ncbi:hypothetical protein [Nocardiopsis ansamitocini]|uniref:Uncharacterized protein n=1 Tax=Nocardiopsis ansamitocini TaxID=1670832 RepID=A0A9W6UJ15_9ACTN|nr:hypothetical protein [Nocardiopsis ansamitocini]GLU48272.1 hypothetical protein Nans01_26230 [Nocardiopsis ansamitocini]